MVTCSHCSKSMPPDQGGHEISVGWSVIRIETHHKTQITISYLYLCPGCALTTQSIQISLTPESP